MSAERKLDGRRVVVVGGSRGLGLGMAEALVDAGAQVTIVARSAPDLAAVGARCGVSTVQGDATDAAVARRVVAEVAPDGLIVAVGAVPPMGRIDELAWEAFAATWETDVKAALFWVQAALRHPLRPGSRVWLTSSGGALHGSPLSGGYAGAKRMLWFLAQYADALSTQEGLGLRFQVLVPQRMVGGTGVGDAGADAYARVRGLTREAFLRERFGPPVAPRAFGDELVDVWTRPGYADARVFGLRGDGAPTVLDGASP